MPKPPTIPEILEEFEAEIVRAPRWCHVDRGLLARVIDDYRRLLAKGGVVSQPTDGAQLFGEGGGG